MKSAFAVALINLLGRVPTALADSLATSVARVALGPKSRAYQTTKTNLANAMPEMDAVSREKLIRASLVDLAKKFPRFARVWVKGPGCMPIADPEDMQTWETLSTHPKGSILLVPHLGNWELLGGWISNHGPLNAMYRPAKIEGLDQLILQGRESSGFKAHPASVKGVASLLKALKKGEMIAILPDQEPDLSSGEFAPFFGVPAYTMTLAYKLAQKSPESPVLVLSAVEVENGHYQVIFERLTPEFGKRDTVAALTEMNQGIEKLVRAYPEQYQWEYKRYKKRPDSSARLY